MEPERERKPSAVSPPGKVEQSGPPARWRNRARGWLAPSADLALAPRRGEKTVLPQSYPAPAPGAARRPYSARTCRLPSRRWFACSRPLLPPVGLRIGRASGEESPGWSRFRAFLCCHSNRYPMRRKPGTDAKFPAQFAGNWLSVQGFAPRDTRSQGRPFFSEFLGRPLSGDFPSSGPPSRPQPHSRVECEFQDGSAFLGRNPRGPLRSWPPSEWRVIRAEPRNREVPRSIGSYERPGE